MPRIRTLKPEFWTDGVIITLPYETRLFYIGMWNHACDRGHVPDDPFGLKLKILPADPVDGGELIQQLVDAGRVTRMVLPDERPFLVIPRFTDHQRVDTRWVSRCPVCAHLDSPELTQTHVSSRGLTRTHTNSEGREGKGREGNRKGGAVAPLSPFCSKHPQGTDKPCRGCGAARMAFEAAMAAERSKPTPVPRRDEDCPRHPNWPVPCQKCVDEAVAS